MTQAKYPIGIQNFPQIRREGYIYIDKTRYIRTLLETGKYYFLSRPRRFGKSLFTSTLKCYFEGRRELFEGLDIARTETEWKRHAVFYISLNGVDYSKPETLDKKLSHEVSQWEQKYGVDPTETTVAMRFGGVIRRACEQTGLGVIIIVDEYDTPLILNLGNQELQDAYRKQLKAFYGVMKPFDEYIKLGFLTGVSKFGHVSIFSDLNNLLDISLDPLFNGICGADQSELERHLLPHIGKLAADNDMTRSECAERIRRDYDGYRFSSVPTRMYNIFSVMQSLRAGRFGRYWFRSGTPTLLVDILRTHSYALAELDGETRTENQLLDVDSWRSDPIPMFFQTGYLTIKDYDRRFGSYTLTIPNEEVREGLYDWLLPIYAEGSGLGPGDLSLEKFVREVERGDADGFMARLRALLSSVPYDLVPRNRELRTADYEVHYQNLCLMLFHLMGLYVHTEYRTSRGRIDVLVETARYVYVIELKLAVPAAGEGTASGRRALAVAEGALVQAAERGYALPFSAGDRRVITIGAAFDPATRTLADWTLSD